MAKDKKAFLLYCDLIHTFDELSDEEAGKLIKHTLAYVNDKSPEATDKIVRIAFEPIKQQLKRDLQRWDEFKVKQSTNGKLGGRPKKVTEETEKPNNPSLISESQKSLNVTVTVTDTVKKEEKEITEKRFEEMIVPEILTVWTKLNPKYISNKEVDFPACLQIAYNIADVKGWRKSWIMGPKESDCLKSWERIATYLTRDDFWKNKTLDTFAKPKTWQKIVNDMRVDKPPPSQTSMTGKPIDQILSKYQ